MIREIGLETARQLLDFSGGGMAQDQAWEEQLEGAVALHNVLVREKFAYLADEVGMGKTYVALGVAALFRHFNPGWRVMYVAPRENIQQKWKKELLNFTANNWRVTDNRVRTFQGLPAYGLAVCANLIDLARAAALNPNRDFLLRLTSFSLALSNTDTSKWLQKRKELLAEIRWLDPELFDLRRKDHFKDHYACAVNAILPKFDLLVIDEGHNLKHGLKRDSAYRNRLLAYVLGHPQGADPKNFLNYGLRFERVLVLSATPLESDYRELWNQLDLFNRGSHWPVLKETDPERESEKERAVGQFLIRRLTTLNIGGERWTKNMYRREWRNGGVVNHDEPLTVADDRQRLIVALVQKKVSEVIGSERFGHSFQIGMLASFESFLETAKVKSVGEDEAANFDDPDQTDDLLQREGVDTPSINRIARSYYTEFHTALPHPKMDAVADSLRDSFGTGVKTLVFVRRVRSVDELTEKLNRHYDQWLKARLLTDLPPDVHPELEAAFRKYDEERSRQGITRVQLPAPASSVAEMTADQGLPIFKDEDDEGGSENFFAWFFRGEKGPAEYLSGAAFKKNRLMSEGSAYSTFFEDNYVRWLLGESEAPVARIADEVGQPTAAIAERLRRMAFGIFREMSRQKRFPRLRVFWAYQEAALALLAEGTRNEAIRQRAQIIRQERFGSQPIWPQPPVSSFPPPDEPLKAKTFFTELVKRPDLRNDLWPGESETDFRAHFRRREQRRELLSAVARLGHPLIDLWVLAITQLNTLRIGAQARVEGRAEALIAEYVSLLDKQRLEGGYTAFCELSDAAHNFDLILAVNFPTVRDAPLSRLPELFGRALARQTPVGGMAGGVNQSLVRQFRMPGYPLVLVTTDVLQEGEDLHTFCHRVMHYGISWTPSAMEQRTGRIDRIRSLTQRRLDNRPEAQPEERLQVFYPHLRDTVELLQVERVYERMNRFVRLLHRSLADEQIKDSTINTLTDFVLRLQLTEPITEPLKTAFPIKDEWLGRDLPVAPIRAEDETRALLDHFREMTAALQKTFFVRPEPQRDAHSFFGTVFVLPDGQLAAPGMSQHLARQQPFTLFLRATTGDSHVLVRCVSPVGVVEQYDEERIEQVWAARERIGFGKICAALDTKLGTYNLTVEIDMLFHSETTQAAEMADLVRRTVACADQMERALLPGLDQAMEVFRDDLLGEPHRG